MLFPKIEKGLETLKTKKEYTPRKMELDSA